jgi:ATP-binding cassette, subfamily G (WHITE), member 2, PDR
MAFPVLPEIIVDGSRMASGSGSDDTTNATKTAQLREQLEMEILSVDNIHLDPNIFNHRKELAKLACELSQRRPSLIHTGIDTAYSSDALIATKSNDTTINPSSPDFNVYHWAKAMLRAADKANVKLRQASFSFRNLNVTGSRSNTNFQASVVSALLKLFQPGKILSFGQKPTKRILGQFDGVVKPGEMLLVLGCPGSGCSTFLKTMAGELHGLNVDKFSEIHYSGIVSIMDALYAFFTEGDRYNSEGDDRQLQRRDRLQF